MRLPHPQLTSICFLFEHPDSLIQAMGNDCSPAEAAEIRRLCELRLPPVTSREALSVMFGYHPGFVWSLVNHTSRYYRYFEIPKGSKKRGIHAPKVALKAIQKWLGYHLQDVWTPNKCVYGFVPGKSHIQAASKHLEAKWVYSVDIENFFPSISASKIKSILSEVGYSTPQSIDLITSLCCLGGRLVQGAPCSPILSNIALCEVDSALEEFASKNDFVFTRYADDIVFSGKITPSSIEYRDQIKSIITQRGWILSQRKEHYSQAPNRLKVHGLLVHEKKLRLTKGYRHRIRAFQHLLDQGKIREEDLAKIKGHINYASQIRS